MATEKEAFGLSMICCFLSYPALMRYLSIMFLNTNSMHTISRKVTPFVHGPLGE